MKKYLFKFTFVCLTTLIINTVQGQRYLTEVFPSTVVASDVNYSNNYSMLSGSPVLEALDMDIYEPAADTLSERPLIILLHSGDFLPRYVNQLPTGDKTDSATVELANRFARMGYVVAVPNYRLGWTKSGTQDIRTETYVQAIYRGMQDAKACIRWFRKNADINGNIFDVDVTRIAMGGEGSGGYISLASNSIDNLAELQVTKFFNFSTSTFMLDTAIIGDWNGFGGDPTLNKDNHAGYSSDFNITFNIGGAIGDSSWIDPCENPIVSIQGVNDAFTPYGYGIVKVPGTTLFVLDVSGSSDVIRIQNRLGNNDSFLSPAISDAYTLQANAMNTALDGTWGNGGDEGLFPIVGINDGNSPWAFWDDSTVIAGATAVGQNSGTILANGYASNPIYQALGPLAGKTRAMTFIDTIQSYLSPRLYRVLFEQLNTAPQLGVDVNLCAGEGVNLSPGNFATYSWSTGDTTSSIYVDTSGSYFVTISDVTGCVMGSDTIVVTELDTINNSVTKNNNIITSNALGATYQWIDCNNGNSFIAGETNASYTATVNGDYAVIVTSNGCSDTSACVNVATVGVSETVIGNQVNIYPNPIKDVVTVQLGNLREVSLVVYSLTGEIVYQAANINTTTHQFKLNNSAGFYILSVIASGETKQYKLIKE